MYGLQSIAHIGQRATDDNAHRVIEVRLTHLLLKIGRKRFLGYLIHNGSAPQSGAGQGQN